MDNYEYLIAGLPVLSMDVSDSDKSDKIYVRGMIDEIRALSSDKDNSLYDLLLSGYEEENFTPEFYQSMLSHPNAFLREFFRFDLNVRNAKVRFLNDKLGRPSNQDIFLEDDGEFEEEGEVRRVLYGSDLLEREKGLDALMWAKIDELNTFDYFNVSALLGYIAKLKIIDRWMSLDEDLGRELFRKLVAEIRGTFKGVEFNET
ncbi:MAG: DUF2764 family protein [Bacteroidales bacterium]|nr:DUF2764 family protein [Bacteroidales bacterium]